jgi:recombination protein RecT
MQADGKGYQGNGGQAPAATTVAKREGGLKDLFNKDYVKNRFAEVMGEKSAAFLASVLNAIRLNSMLEECDQASVLSSAMAAAALDLPIDSSLGFSAIVPYRTKGRLVAQFQIMTKGFVQLALRSGQYKTMNVGPIYKDELKGYDIVTGDVFIEPVENGFRAQEREDMVAGYVAFFRLLNGFERREYWPMGKIVAHGKRYSKSFNNEYGLWKTDLPAMASKTVLKNMISKWGILSTSMQMAVKVDQASIKDFDAPLGDDANLDYVDRGASDAVDVEARDEKPAATEAPRPAAPAALPASQNAERAPEKVPPAEKPEPVKAPITAAKPEPVKIGRAEEPVALRHRGRPTATESAERIAHECGEATRAASAAAQAACGAPEAAADIARQNFEDDEGLF